MLHKYAVGKKLVLWKTVRN